MVISRILHLKELVIMNNNINVLALAYIGDSVYEVYVRNYLIQSGFSKVDKLQKEAIKYVSAKSQSKFVMYLIENNMLNDDEIDVYMRARNHKNGRHPKNTDIITYKHSTGFEAIIGYLYLNDNFARIDEIFKFILEV